ncbi:MAG: divergent PAP2 family protein [Candidatus Omnitrophica bacterium]|nr:divergent PAP2 family protein [Candidatus Omnitrophota bacterium]
MISFEAPFSEARGYAAVILSWLGAQTIKVVRGAIQEKKLDFRWFLNSGGMPSSHSAAVASLSTVVGLYYGFGSIPFGITLVYSLIIMFDAAGVRRNVGRQAVILNKIVDEMSKGKQLEEKRLKELLGHTPKEVFAGALFGIVMSLILCH